MAMKSALLWSALQTGTRLVLSFISIKVTAVYLANPLGHIIEKIAIMGDGKNSPLIFFEKLFKPKN